MRHALRCLSWHSYGGRYVFRTMFQICRQHFDTIRDGTLLEHLGIRADAIVPPTHHIHVVLRCVQNGKLSSDHFGDVTSDDDTSSDDSSERATSDDGTSDDQTAINNLTSDDSWAGGTSSDDASGDCSSEEYDSDVENSHQRALRMLHMLASAHAAAPPARVCIAAVAWQCSL